MLPPVDCMGRQYAGVQETLIDERSALRETSAKAGQLRLPRLSLLCLLLRAAACSGAGARTDAGTGGQSGRTVGGTEGGGTSGGSAGTDVDAGGSGGDGGQAGTSSHAGTAGMGMAEAGGVGVDPYGRCNAPNGAVLNSPECPVPNSTCNAWWCSPRCPANVGTGDDCPLPLTGTAERVCNFSLCDLSCQGGLVCPEGMECAGGNCRWPAP